MKKTQEEIETLLMENGIKWEPFSYSDLHQKINYECPSCGNMKSGQIVHIFNGHALCKKCSGKEVRSQEQAERELREKNIEFKDFSYVNNGMYIESKCPDCGKWKKSRFIDLLKGHDLCTSCGRRKREQTFTQEQAEEKLKNAGIVFKPFVYSIGKKTEVDIKCRKCDEYFTVQFDFPFIFNGGSLLCPTHRKSISEGELEIKTFISSLGIDFNENIKIDSVEVDVFVSSRATAFEYNGLYWHSEIFKQRDFHFNKTEVLRRNGIRLIHIWEDDWYFKREICKSFIANVLGKTPEKINARDCTIKYPSVKERNDFLNNNHLLGTTPAADISLGLYSDNEYVAMMTFGKGRNGDFLMSRFCCKQYTSVRGGFSKMFHFFTENFKDYDTVKTFADYAISDGWLYEKNGFVRTGITKPDYQYILPQSKNVYSSFKCLRRLTKQNFTHKKLVEEGYDASKSEREIMLERKIPRLYDCGKLVYVWNRNRNAPSHST
jgi:formylmethanofuran dehydrogenase subunit E